MDRVMPVEIELVAEMARINLRLRDLKVLRVGDLLPLGPISGATLRANGKPVLAGEAGHANGQRSMKVKRKLS
jgi:flagellar motor switch protein FliM